MASHALAQMLDELMGKDRNLAPTEKRDQVHWSDPDVCKHFLVNFCPHELFTNTRADLGPCTKLHDEALRKEYTKSSKSGKMGYEDDFLRFLQGLISDVEKRIRRGHQRLALNNSQGSLSSNLNSLKDDKIKMLTERIADLVQQAEELGCEGKVEEAQGMMKLCDQLEEERRDLESSKLQQQSNEPEKTMEVSRRAMLGSGPSSRTGNRKRIKLMKKERPDLKRKGKKERRKEKKKEKKDDREKRKGKRKERNVKEKGKNGKRKDERRGKKKERGKEIAPGVEDHEAETGIVDQGVRGRRSRSRSRDRHRSHRRRSRSSSRSRTKDRDSRRSSRSKEKSKERRSRSRDRRESRDRRSRSKRSKSRERSDDRKSGDKRERSSDRKSKEREEESKDESDNKGTEMVNSTNDENEQEEAQPENTESQDAVPNDTEAQEDN
uniref:Luc7-like protein 3 n=1 Tax=Magallana gigas TaxID=29159 RepID=A0A8W8JF15_MAGGI